MSAFRDIIAFIVSCVKLVIEVCNSNIVLQFSLYSVVFFLILGAFKVVWSSTGDSGWSGYYGDRASARREERRQQERDWRIFRYRWRMK